MCVVAEMIFTGGAFPSAHLAAERDPADATDPATTTAATGPSLALAGAELPERDWIRLWLVLWQATNAASTCDCLLKHRLRP